MSSVDGTTDYSQFSDAELNDARVRVDFVLRPLDHENLRIENKSRKDRRKRKLLPIMLKVAGVHLALGGGAAFFTMLPHLFKTAFIPLLVVLFVAYLVISATSLMAGVLLLTKIRAAPYLGAIAALLQVLQIVTDGFRYQFNPLYAVLAYWHNGEVGFTIQSGLNTDIAVGQFSDAHFGIDLVS